ncbi:MAG: peptidoglycan DD-metalloendopeptidase family protein [Saprospiraceae bacterium]|nr:peptidoglycan DD-metalloendopeptidase family protein [Candidatus Vicinibacter affinis]
MDHDHVEVIASAPGILIDKHDGEFDKNCAGVSSSAKVNYAVIQHADGSRAIYFHMKSGKITTKAIGENIAAGEKIGIVGSSGNSSGPHLHFEIWAGSTVSILVDPFAGNCNVKNAQSWWNTQKIYKDPELIHASVHTTDVVIPACPTTETPNQTEVCNLPFQGSGLPAGFAMFYIFLRNETNGKVVEMSIINPDQTTFTSWTRNSNNDSKFSYWGYSKKLPTIPGRYTFSATYNGRTCSQMFEVKVPSDVKTPLSKLGRINLEPNPFKISTKIILPNVAENVSYAISIGIGQVVKFSTIPADNTLEITRDNLLAGLYFLKLNKVSLSNNTTKMLIGD